jgi:hypothetical protein
MKHIEATVDLAVDADTAWKTIGDPGGLADWLPAIDAARMDGDIRFVEFAGGMGSGREQILAHDDAGRTLRYAYLEGPIPLQDYTATMTVEPAASGPASSGARPSTPDRPRRPTRWVRWCSACSTMPRAT